MRYPDRLFSEIREMFLRKMKHDALVELTLPKMLIYTLPNISSICRPKRS
jgi:hypothetical protein